MEPITQDIAVVQKWLYTFALSTPRILMILLILPIANASVLPFMARAALTICLSLIVVPAAFAAYPQSGLAGGFVAAIITKEVFVGVLLGFVASIIFWVVESIGYFVDTHRGATLSGALLLTHGESSSPLGSFLLQLFTVLFFVGGGITVFLEGLYQSFVVWPIFTLLPSINLESAQFFINQFGLLFYLAALLAGPMIAAMFLAEFTLALISRFVPQLQVFFLALPIKSAIAVFVLVLYLSTLVLFLRNEFTQIGVLYAEFLDVLR
jgi:type III secretion protein T